MLDTKIYLAEDRKDLTSVVSGLEAKCGQPSQCRRYDWMLTFSFMRSVVHTSVDTSKQKIVIGWDAKIYLRQKTGRI